MKTVNRIKIYIKNGEWYADKISVGSYARICAVCFLGIGKTYDHTYKNGNVETRWKLVDSLGPKDEVWFLLGVRILSTSPGMSISEYNMAIKVDKNKITYEWLTLKFRISKSMSCLSELSDLEVAHLMSAIEDALSKG